jgi:hypothetical protein
MGRSPVPAARCSGRRHHVSLRVGLLLAVWVSVMTVPAECSWAGPMFTAAFQSSDADSASPSVAMAEVSGGGRPDTNSGPCAEEFRWIAVDRTIRVSAEGTGMLRGPFQRVAGDTLYLGTDDSERRVPVSRITGLWIQRNASKKGARLGATFGGVGGGVLGVFACELGHGLDDQPGGVASSAWGARSLVASLGPESARCSVP